MSAGEAAIFVMLSDPEQLGAMRAWLRRQLAHQELAPRDCADLVLAVGELCTNAIKHAYEGSGGQPIRVRVCSAGEQLVIDVEHGGRRFDAAGYVAPDLDALPERGMGLYIARTVADRFSFGPTGEAGTRWTLVKDRRRAGPAAGAEGS
jgi:anti-sigma regulatory factor (Ser/Thr protein kinase)